MFSPETGLLTGHVVSVQPGLRGVPVSEPPWFARKQVWFWHCSCGAPAEPQTGAWHPDIAAALAQDHLDAMIPEVPVA